MTYNFKRALGISAALYVSTFIVGIICGIILGHDMSTMENIPDSFWYIGMVAAAVLSALFTLWYFKNASIARSAKSGFLFGLTGIAVSSVLDLIFFSLGNAGGANVDLSHYYGDFRFWITLLIVLATTTLIGWHKAKK